MKKLIAILAIVVILSGCATMGSRSNDTDYTRKDLTVVEKTVEQNVWDIFKIGVSGLINAILLNNYFIHP